jgi:hypothetical protein
MFVLLNCLAFQSLVVPETRRAHYISSLRLYLPLAVFSHSCTDRSDIHDFTEILLKVTQNKPKQILLKVMKLLKH